MEYRKANEPSFCGSIQLRIGLPSCAKDQFTCELPAAEGLGVGSTLIACANASPAMVAIITTNPKRESRESFFMFAFYKLLRLRRGTHQHPAAAGQPDIASVREIRS